MKRWKILSKDQRSPFDFAQGKNIKDQKLDNNKIIEMLLENRGLKTKKEIDEFLHPNLSQVTVDSVEIDKKHLKRAIDRIKTAVENNEQIVIFGDYDVDGICGTAILWETIYSFYKNVIPYIPHRIEEGYGLSVKGIENLLAVKVTPLSRSHLNKIGLIITVDNGIVATSAVEFAKQNGIDVIITDHHVPGKKLPDAHAIVHTTKLCGAGVAYLLSQNIKYQISKIKNEKEIDGHIELVALATIADLVPLTGANRTFVKFGIHALRKTIRPGLVALFKEAGIDSSKIGVYEVGHIIAPRLNAMGRLDYAMDSLRLLCTKDQTRAEKLAHIVGSTNRERQQLTEETVEHARNKVMSYELGIKNLLFIADESYQQGVIGLVAGKLVEEFYRPSIVVSIGQEYSKASARSVNGFNIIEFIRSASELFIDAGGHPMAAGFTVETAKLILLQEKLEQMAEKLLNDEKLTRELKIDCELPLSIVDGSLYQAIQQLAPFGMGNSEPTFATRGVVIENMRLVGGDGKHLKLNIKDQKSNIKYNAIAFGMGERAKEFHIGDSIDIAYTIDEDKWLAPRSVSEVGNGNRKLQLKIKDIK